MKKFLSSVFCLVFLGIAAFAQEYVPSEILIKVNKENQRNLILDRDQLTTGISVLDGKNHDLNLVEIEPIGNYQKTATFRLVFENSLSVEDLIETYQKLGVINYAEPNYIAYAGGQEIPLMPNANPNDPYFSYQWGLHNDGSFNINGMNMGVTEGADANLMEAWDLETGDPDMVIAVPDSGMNMTHQDIVDMLWVNPNETENGGDSDGNGFVDDIYGWNFVGNNNNPADDLGHGTNCAGIISATANNNKGYTGVNWNSKTMTLKVLNQDNQGTIADMASSIYYAVDNGAKIVSMSIGAGSLTSTLENAVAYMADDEVLLVACMMNFNNQTTYYPAGHSLDFDNVIAVGATDADDTRTQPFFWDSNSGSNYGSHINVVAPGNYIYGLGIANNTSYNTYWGGTSQATPLVAGVASLVWAANPNLTPGEVRDIIEQTAEDQVGNPAEDTAGFDIYYGWGRVNAYEAVMAAKALGVENHNFVEKDLRLVNPVQNQRLEFYSQLDFSGKAQISASGMDSKRILNTQMEVAQGQNSLELPGLATGSYMLTIQMGDYKKTFKLVVR